MHDHPSRGAPARSRCWRRPRLAALVGVLAVGVAVAACGGGDKPSGVASLGGAGSATSTTTANGSQDEQQAALNWARCMRQHGVNLPDPQITAEGIDQPSAPGVRKDDPRVIAAEQACLQRGGGGK